jgi:uncharacterized coiled-coil protein SlyX
MTTKDFRYAPNTIEPSEQSPMVSTLLSVIEKLTDQLSQQAEVLTKQSEKIDELLTEIRQLKKLSKKPKLRASSLLTAQIIQSDLVPQNAVKIQT